ncbi:MAG: fasciclin domain-containing protein [Pseudomonadota bacterium]
MNAITRIATTALLAAGLAACAQQETPQATGPDIVDTAVAAGDFTTLVAAVEAADLTTALKGDGPYTVFAPNDAAFAKLPAGTVETLLLPENRGTLVTLISYHVLDGTVRAGDLGTEPSVATTINGLDLPVDPSSGVVVGGNATVIAADIAASNGVIHVVDTVLMP